jgi:cystathionine beta-lyase
VDGSESGEVSADLALSPVTRLLHDDRLRTGEPDPHSPVVPPIYQTSLFTFASYAEMELTVRGEQQRAVYSRGNNPTVAAFEQKVAALEGAEAARATASGMAAISMTVLSQLSAGDRVVCVRDVYPDTYKLLSAFLPRFGVTVDFIDGSDTDAFVAALPGARLAYLESPTSLTFQLQDLEAITAAARRCGVTTILDNSWATPLHQRPLQHGVDLVVHTASKYLGGHSDVVAGVVVGSRAVIGGLSALEYSVLGGKLSPLEAFLLLRGLRTLPVRLAHQAAAGLKVARWLSEQPQVSAVHHPGLAEGVQGERFRRYFSGASSLFSIELAGGPLQVRAFVDALRLFQLGVSWGGYESLVYPAAIGHSAPPGPNAQRDFGVSPQLIRLHVGLEDPDDLIRDLAGALVARERVAGKPVAGEASRRPP